MRKPVYLLDTNVISELSKPNPNMKLVKMVEANKPLCAISSTTWHELLYGLNIMPEGKKNHYLFEFIVDYVQANFPVIDFDNHAAWIQSDLRSRLKETGTLVDYADTEIAATAISNQMILVSRNTKHFEPIQQVDSVFYMENWFEA